MTDWARRLLGDRVRFVSAAVLVSLLVAFGADTFDHAVHDASNPRHCLDDLSQCVGEEVVLSVWRVLDVEADGFVVGKLDQRIGVRGVGDGLAPGARISLTGIFDENGQLVESRREVHRHWWMKRNLGVLATLLVGVWFVRSLGWERGGLVCHG